MNDNENDIQYIKYYISTDVAKNKLNETKQRPDAIINLHMHKALPVY